MVSRELLETLYENIRQEKFETQSDNIQRIYARMMFLKNRRQFDNNNIKEIITELKSGCNFYKYGR